MPSERARLRIIDTHIFTTLRHDVACRARLIVDIRNQTLAVPHSHCNPEAILKQGDIN
jgi:hypothetical protein